jgi:hypothetical protein
MPNYNILLLIRDASIPIFEKDTIRKEGTLKNALERTFSYRLNLNLNGLHVHIRDANRFF